MTNNVDDVPGKKPLNPISSNAPGKTQLSDTWEVLKATSVDAFIRTLRENRCNYAGLAEGRHYLWYYDPSPSVPDIASGKLYWIESSESNDQQIKSALLAKEEKDYQEPEQFATPVQLVNWKKSVVLDRTWWQD